MTKKASNQTYYCRRHARYAGWPVCKIGKSFLKRGEKVECDPIALPDRDTQVHDLM